MRIHDSPRELNNIKLECQRSALRCISRGNIKKKPSEPHQRKEFYSKTFG